MGHEIIKVNGGAVSLVSKASGHYTDISKCEGVSEFRMLLGRSVKGWSWWMKMLRGSCANKSVVSFLIN